MDLSGAPVARRYDSLDPSLNESLGAPASCRHLIEILEEQETTEITQCPIHDTGIRWIAGNRQD